MSEHDQIAKLLPLAATGDITPGEIRRIREHLAVCDECRRVSNDYALLGSALRGLPTPQPSAELLARVRVIAAPKLAQKQVRSRDTLVLAPLVAASWIVALTTWPWVRAAGTWVLTGWPLPGGGFAHALVVYSILGFLLASVAAIAVGRYASAIGRIQ
jgi:predicted anti-sigma-YlaC factor YlaD